MRRKVAAIRRTCWRTSAAAARHIHRVMAADRDWLSKDPARAQGRMDYLQDSWTLADITNKLKTQPALQTRRQQARGRRIEGLGKP